MNIISVKDSLINIIKQTTKDQNIIFICKGRQLVDISICDLEEISIWLDGFKEKRKTNILLPHGVFYIYNKYIVIYSLPLPSTNNGVYCVGCGSYGYGDTLPYLCYYCRLSFP